MLLPLVARASAASRRRPKLATCSSFLSAVRNLSSASSSAPDPPAAAAPLPPPPSTPSGGAVTALLERVREMGSHAHDVSTNTLWPDLKTMSATTPGLLPTSVSLASCAAAWLVLPRVLRRVHRYVEDGPTARLLLRRSGDEEHKHPYDLTVWAAMEDPTRLFVTLIAFSQVAALVAPTTVAEQYLGQIWNGGLIVSGLWFLHRWKSIAFSRVLAGKTITKDAQDRYLALDKVSSVAMIVLGAMSLAEMSGVAVQSILTVGGVGGIAAAFAARDVLGNAFGGFLLQFLKPFSVGDTITAGNIEGQVVEVGLHSTLLLNADKYPIAVPNSLFLNQMIVNKSRATKQMLRTKLYIDSKDVKKVPEAASRMLDFLRSHPKVLSQEEAPLCYISRVDPLSAEITMAYEIRPMKRQESLALEQEILVKAVTLFQSNA